jgi:hypothetical protein
MNKYIFQHIKALALIISVSILISACSLSNSTTSDVNSKSILSELNVNGHPFKLAGFIKPPEGMSSEDFNAECNRLLTAQIQTDDYQNHNKIFYQQLRNASSLTQVHRATKEYFMWVKSLPLILAMETQQLVAQSILRTYLLNAPITQESQQMTEFYVNLLIEQKIWGATELYAPSLLALRGYWSDEKIVRTAKAIVTHRFPKLNTQKEFLAQSAWCALKSGYSKSETTTSSQIYRSGNTISNEFDEVSIQKTTNQLVKEYEEYIQFYPRRKLPQIPKRDNKGIEIALVDEMQGLAILTLMAKIQ